MAKENTRLIVKIEYMKAIENMGLKQGLEWSPLTKTTNLKESEKTTKKLKENSNTQTMKLLKEK